MEFGPDLRHPCTDHPKLPDAEIQAEPVAGLTIGQSGEHAFKTLDVPANRDRLGREDCRRVLRLVQLGEIQPRQELESNHQLPVSGAGKVLKTELRKELMSQEQTKT